MAREWIREDNPKWDDDKKRIIGDAPTGIFDRRFAETNVGESLPAEWWRVVDDGKTVAYGWLDLVWGDAEVVVATDPDCRRQGLGTFTMRKLEDEARERGVNYVYNIVRPTHPEKDGVTAWLGTLGFESSEDGSQFRVLTKARA